MRQGYSYPEEDEFQLIQLICEGKRELWHGPNVLPGIEVARTNDLIIILSEGFPYERISFAQALQEGYSLFRERMGLEKIKNAIWYHCLPISSIIDPRFLVKGHAGSCPPQVSVNDKDLEVTSLAIGLHELGHCLLDVSSFRENFYIRVSRERDRGNGRGRKEETFSRNTFN